ncbi:uncharacterized protein VTP21DRAFT_3721 [Calcarisporiella thermophila]|uniref:uncharacterized protein n=1 Tax=Calcarisporiella thermophila TaxID=911321 RepID=UPI0037438699
MKQSTVITLCVLSALAAAGVGYAIYFDHKRRNDPQFRRKLKKEKKRAQKVKQEKEEASKKELLDSLKSALEEVDKEKFPDSVEAKEKYFMDYISKGEALFVQGESKHQEAAICFFKALKVYPQPMELVMIYQKTIPESVFALVMGMMQLDIKRKQEQYYESYPPAEWNVKIGEIPEGHTADGKTIIRRALVATKDFEANELIYREEPLLSMLEPELLGKEFCDYCMRKVTDESKISCEKCDRAVYCSTSCKDKAAAKYHNHICGPEAAPLHELEQSSKIPSMIARFLTTMVHDEMQKVTDPNAAEETAWDHIERLRYLDLPKTKEEEREMEALKVALRGKVPGVEEFLNDERYLLLKGKLLYNLYGIYGVEGVVQPSDQLRSPRERPIIGSGLYRATSYMVHSCVPNVKVDFREDHTLSLIAAKPIKAGDELRVSFIEVADRSLEERKKDLERYRYECSCPKCQSDVE